jgi:hypothetical protein
MFYFWRLRRDGWPFFFRHFSSEGADIAGDRRDGGACCRLPIPGGARELCPAMAEGHDGT